MSTVKIGVTLLGRTDLAILVNDGRKEAWVPLSQIEEEIQEATGEMGLVTTAIVVPAWVAREKGLLPQVNDEFTLSLF